MGVRVRKRGRPKKNAPKDEENTPAKINSLAVIREKSLAHDRDLAMNRFRTGEAKKYTIYKVRNTGRLELIRIIKASSNLHDDEFFNEVMQLSSLFRSNTTKRGGNTQGVLKRKSEKRK